MNTKDKLKFLEQLMTKGEFPNEHNRVWTMCQAALQMCIMAVAEAERCNMTNKQFYLSFEDSINKLSVKDHTDSDVSNLEADIKQFNADSGSNS